MSAPLRPLALLALAACGGAPDPAPFAGRPVCLVVIDTLRADHFPGYGPPPFAAAPPPAPQFERIAAGGVLFERTWSTSSWTAPATATIFTGLTPRRHGVWTGLNLYEQVRERGGDSAPRLNRIPEALETLPEAFRAAGYATLGIADNPNVCDRMGFADGFDRFHGEDYAGAEPLVDRAIEWLAEVDEASQPWFLYLHFMDPHTPYHARPPSRTRRRCSRRARRRSRTCAGATRARSPTSTRTSRASSRRPTCSAARWSS